MKRRYLFAWFLCSLAPTLSVLAAAPPGRYMVGGGTVYDTYTKLTWEQTPTASSHSQSAAAAYCAAYAGGGWRLPSRAELLSIVDPTQFTPAIDPTAFPNTTGTLFWSSSVYVGIPNYGWLVDFISGYTQINDNTITTLARCVR